MCYIKKSYDQYGNFNLLKFVDLVVDVEVTMDLRMKLRIFKMIFTKPLADVDVKYQFLSLRTVLTHAHHSHSF